jgi:hypothetical protein
VSYFPIVPSPPDQAEPKLPIQKRPRLTQDLDAELVERARYESLRNLAIAYDVSHETIRAALGRQHRRALAALTGG